MSISGIDKAFAPIEAIKGLNKSGQAEGIGSKEEGASFGSVLSNALKEVDTLQTSADTQIQGLLTGSSPVTTHDAMIALEKADVAFQLMSQIRTKIVRAYEEIMRTQV